MATPESFIGIDLGTTFLKGAVLDLEHVCLGRTERLPFPNSIPGLPVGYHEVNPQAIVTAVRSLIEQLLPHAPGCAGLVMCTQMHGLVLCDERGTALSNAITWQDQRALESHPSGQGSYYDVMSQQISQTERLALGNDLWASRPLTSLYWMKEHVQRCEVLRNLTGLTIPASLPDFVLANLCCTAPTTELTNAAAYGALDLRRGDWHHELISRLGLDHLRWPRIRALGEVSGVLDIGGHTLPCYKPVGDHQCAVLGTLLGDDELSINVSTGSQVGVIAHTLDIGDSYQTRPYFGGDYLKAVIHIPAGRALNALLHLLTELPQAAGISVPDPWAYISQATEAIDQTDLRVNLAFFPSSCGDTGSMSNMREENLSVGHLFMAAFQNMAENYRACAERVAPSQHYQRLVFSGGLVQKLARLRRAILAQFNLGYRFAPSSEDTLIGLLVLALSFSGKASSLADATRLVAEMSQG